MPSLWTNEANDGLTGVVATACVQDGDTRNTGNPWQRWRDHQPDAREGQAGLTRVAERLVVPMKPGNAGGGKGPQFKVNGDGGGQPGDWR